MSNSSLKTRKLRPLIPKPNTSNIPKNTTQYSMTNSCTYICSCNPSTPHFSLNQKMGSETNTQPISVMSSRWNPTPEQLCALEEMYVCGTRTPTAEQIQQIAAKLRKFGKIEGKNVFYWFQNHKARERQKRRRILESLSEEQVRYNFENPEELNKTSFEVGQRKKWARATLSNCSTLSEECVSIHRAVLAAESETTDGWTQFEERESSIILSKNATWQTPSISLLNTVEDFGTKESKLSTKNSKEEYYFTYSEDESRQSKTLQLFPARSDEWNDVNALDNNTELPVPTTMSTNFTPNQYFEFLPLKN